MWLSANALALSLHACRTLMLPDMQFCCLQLMPGRPNDYVHKGDEQCLVTVWPTKQPGALVNGVSIDLASPGCMPCIAKSLQRCSSSAAECQKLMEVLYLTSRNASERDSPTFDGSQSFWMYVSRFFCSHSETA